MPTRGVSTNIRLWFVPVATVFLLLLSGKALLGQTSTAVLTGTIRDASGAILPGVTVTSTNIQTDHEGQLKDLMRNKIR